MTKKLATLGLLSLLAACSASERFAAPAPVVDRNQRIGFASVEVRDVSLPSYAAADEIHVQSPDGKLSTESGALWADTPDRAVAMDVALALSRMSGARVAAEPWPLEAYPQARLELRFSDLVAGSDGQFRASGQYFVAVLDGGRERSGLFNLAVPFDPAGGPAAIVAARGQLMVDLARFIAKDGLN
ncbi:MAG: PqiC family protein [Sulfitobacter sp.]